MKLQLFVVLAVIAGTYALPQASDVVVVAESSNESIQRSFVEDQIRRYIERVSEIIKFIGLDPLEVERRDIEIIPVTIDLVVKAFVENLKFTGASDIQIHTLYYNHFFNRLRLDISLPEISLTIGDSGLEALVVGREIEGQLKGSLIIRSIRLAGEVHVDVSLEGVLLRSLSVNFSLGGIESDLTLVVQGNDISENVNHFLGDRIPFFFEDNRDDINKLLEDVISEILNRRWSL